MYEDVVWIKVIKNGFNSRYDISGERVKILICTHDIEVEFRYDPEEVQHLVKHVTMLSGYTDLHRKSGLVFSELPNEGRHFDGLRACAKNNKYLLQNVSDMILVRFIEIEISKG